ncbi:MAG TPA: transporter [Flavobacterium sp.]|nr:transporter [Flavobacterium sp.]
MHIIKNLVIAFFFSLPIIHYGQRTDQINSNRPGETMSAYAVGKSVIQVESGIYGITESHSIQNYDANGFGVDMTLRWGLFMERLELIADFQYQYEVFEPAIAYPEKSDFKQSILGAKYLIYDPFKNYEKNINVFSWKANHAFNWHQFIPAVSVFVGANFILDNNPYYFSPEAAISPKAILIAQNHFGDGTWVLVTNIIADYIGTDYPSYGYGLTLTKGFNRKWSGFIENQGYMSDFYSDAIVRGGAAFLIHDDMQIDASLSTNFKDTPSILYGGVGFSWRYDANYKEIRMKVDTGDSDKKAKRKAKKTKKG